MLIVFFLLLAFGVPIAYSLGISAIVTLVINMDTVIAATTISQRMATSLDSFSLLAIPFFILAGQIMNKGGIAQRLIAFAKALLGFLPGGLAYVNILACMLFGAISGSAVAAASAIGGFMTSTMEKEGYPKPFSAAVNITSATTGLVIPPSNVLIVYSLASGGASIAALFLAGYLPGILMGLALIVVSAYYAWKHGLPKDSSLKFLLIFKTFLSAVPSLFLLVLVMGGIIAGIFTATEASAIAVIYAFLLAVIYREVTLKDFPAIFLDTVRTTSVVLMLVACSMAMSWVLSFENIPQEVSQAMLTLTNNKILILLMINLLLLIVGIFMDMTPAVLIFTPIFLPVVTALGMSEIHFGIMMVMNLCIGLCTPPVGSVLFVGLSVSQVSIKEVIRPLMPMFIALVLVLLLVTFVPAVSEFLPNLFLK